MTKQVQRRRGTAAQHTSFTGAEGEISVNTTNKSVHVHDGTTAGGIEAARADLGNVSDANLNAALSGNTLASLTITSADINGGTIDGTVIGGSTAAAISGTTGSFSGLDVVGSAQIGANAAKTKFYSDSTYSGIFNGATLGSNESVYMGAGALFFYGGGVERLRIDAAGNVGIGAAGSFSGVDIYKSGSTISVVAARNDTSTTLMYATTSASFAGTTTNTPYGFVTNNTERLRIDASGNVGIGTSSPAAKLHIDGGTGQVVQVGPLSLTNFADEGSGVIFGRTTDGALTQAIGTVLVDSLGVFGRENIVLATGGSGLYGATTERMRITSAGSVGIGTSSPNGKLDVSDGAYVLSNGTTYIGGMGKGTGIIGAGANDVGITTAVAASNLVFGTVNTERMRIDASGNLGLGTSSPAGKLDVVGAIRLTNTANAANFGTLSDGGGLVITSDNSNPMYFNTGGAERMRIDASGNLLVGGTTAGNAGTVSINVGNAGATAGGLQMWAGTAQTSFVQFGDESGTAANHYRGYMAYAHASDSMQFGTASTERMRIDASGTLGLGVTPSTWNTAFDGRFQFGVQGVLASTSTSSQIGLNWYYDGTYRYIGTGEASRFYQVGGTFVFENAASGTAGNAITFTDRMHITNTGAVGIGTSTPLSIFEISGGANNTYMRINDTRATVVYVGSESGAMSFGAWGISERMRIDSSGNLLVGTTSNSGSRFTLVAGAAQNAINIIVPTVDYFGATIHNQGTTGDNTFMAFATEASFTTRGNIVYNRAGGLTAYNTTSDYRAKDIAGPISNASGAVLNLKPYMGTMKGATVERPMFVAHETQEIAPYAVTGEKDAVDGDGNPKYQQMDHSALVPLLTAALQEALQKIEALEARITALEA
jgi:hypothetical protein